MFEMEDPYTLFLVREWKGEVRNVLTASKSGVEMGSLEQQLEALMGKKIPLGEMGFRCLGDFLFELRDMLEVYHFPQEDPSQRRTRLFLFIQTTAIYDLKLHQRTLGQQRNGSTNHPSKDELVRCDPIYLLRRQGQGKGVASYFDLDEGAGGGGDGYNSDSGHSSLTAQAGPSKNSFSPSSSLNPLAPPFRPQKRELQLPPIPIPPSTKPFIQYYEGPILVYPPPPGHDDKLPLIVFPPGLRPTFRPTPTRCPLYPPTKTSTSHKAREAEESNSKTKDTGRLALPEMDRDKKCDSFDDDEVDLDLVEGYVDFGSRVDSSSAATTSSPLPSPSSGLVPLLSLSFDANKRLLQTAANGYKKDAIPVPVMKNLSDVDLLEDHVDFVSKKDAYSAPAGVIPSPLSCPSASASVNTREKEDIPVMEDPPVEPSSSPPVPLRPTPEVSQIPAPVPLPLPQAPVPIPKPVTSPVNLPQLPVKVEMKTEPSELRPAPTPTTSTRTFSRPGSYVDSDSDSDGSVTDAESYSTRKSGIERIKRVRPAVVPDKLDGRLFFSRNRKFSSEEALKQAPVKPFLFNQNRLRTDIPPFPIPTATPASNQENIRPGPVPLNNQRVINIAIAIAERKISSISCDEPDAGSRRSVDDNDNKGMSEIHPEKDNKIITGADDSRPTKDPDNNKTNSESEVKFEQVDKGTVGPKKYDRETLLKIGEKVKVPADKCLKKYDRETLLEIRKTVKFPPRFSGGMLSVLAKDSTSTPRSMAWSHGGPSRGDGDQFIRTGRSGPQGIGPRFGLGRPTDKNYLDRGDQGRGMNSSMAIQNPRKPAPPEPVELPREEVKLPVPKAENPQHPPDFTYRTPGRGKMIRPKKPLTSIAGSSLDVFRNPPHLQIVSALPSSSLSRRRLM